MKLDLGSSYKPAHFRKKTLDSSKFSQHLCLHALGKREQLQNLNIVRKGYHHHQHEMLFY